MNRVDLHTHTTASDGTNQPQENVRLAKEKGLQAIAITDHDTVNGIKEAMQAGSDFGVEVIPGIEISTLSKGQDIHVLGYFVDYQSTAFVEEVEELRDVRRKRNRMMITRMQELGIAITMDEVAQKQTKQGGNIGRPHMAEVLMEKGVVSSMEEAFETYLGKEGKAYINPPRISPEEGVKLILCYGGVPVLAHPGLYDQDELIDDLVKVGLKGIEVNHPDHSEAEVKKYHKMAQERQLLVTGGSDYHGVRHGEVFHGDLGSQPVTEEHLSELKKVHEQIN
ncbi:PHP domain-containing protein [Caldalkalibacillus salinus]|uniref:PHP domain-containing protein n=1 Tax=Caldalkalibacillus salinus TaxID=2803787 RepID=UPI0019224C1C|nr:PHP domain-containing protein [Caldalkalibacillus salinus]